VPPDSLSPYTALVDVDPPIAVHILDALAEADIPAYAEPVVGEIGPYREVRGPDRPITRVYVLRDQRDAARAILTSTLPGLRAEFHADADARATREQLDLAELDDRWAQIVDSFGERATIDDPDAQGSPGSGLSRRLIRRGDRTAEAPEPDDVDDEPLDAVDRFVPPEPPPIPRPHHIADRFGWAGVILGPLLVVIAFVLRFDAWIALAGGAAFIAGFITLIARMQDRPRDGWDDGAVV
jgi:hypothetical protein